MSKIRWVLLLLLITVSAFAQQSNQAPPPNPCLAPEQKQLEFWVGDWDLTWPSQKAGETVHGSNSINRIMDGCVVQESFSSPTANYHGTSLSIFDTTDSKWKQTWVDSGGAYLDFVGEFKDGQMILGREATGPNGAKSLQRMVFKNISANEFDWSWESSKDNGKTWQVNWPSHYKRKS